MPRIQRDTIILCRFEQWSFARIAHHLSTDQMQVEHAFCDAMLKLQKALAPETPESGNG
jgi:DNA-directed RNA polymerase specialized sigma24 family protein